MVPGQRDLGAVIDLRDTASPIEQTQGHIQTLDCLRLGCSAVQCIGDKAGDIVIVEERGQTGRVSILGIVAEDRRDRVGASGPAGQRIIGRKVHGEVEHRGRAHFVLVIGQER